MLQRETVRLETVRRACDVDSLMIAFVPMDIMESELQRVEWRLLNGSDLMTSTDAQLHLMYRKPKYFNGQNIIAFCTNREYL